VSIVKGKMMSQKLLKSKIHRAVVTGSDSNYVGSITINKNLLEKAGIREFEFVQVVNINNSPRFDTYVVAGQADSGVI
jgi:aspartate 1-decarboxylase